MSDHIVSYKSPSLAVVIRSVTHRKWSHYVPDGLRGTVMLEVSSKVLLLSRNQIVRLIISNLIF